MTEQERLYIKSAVDPAYSPFNQNGEMVAVTMPDNSKRLITAIIDRRNIDSSDHRPATPMLRAKVLNDSVRGIASSEMDARGSIKMSVPYRMGTPAQSFGVYFRPEHEGKSHDGVFLYLILR